MGAAKPSVSSVTPAFRSAVGHNSSRWLPVGHNNSRWLPVGHNNSR